MPTERIPFSVASSTLRLIVATFIAFSPGGRAFARELPHSADSDGVTHLIVESSATAVGTDGWTSQLIKAANLVRHSSDKAERLCSQLLEDALLDNNRAAAAVAMMNRACARMQMHGIQNGVDDFRSAFAQLPDYASKTMRVLFLQAACRYERFSGRDRYRIRIESLNSELVGGAPGIPMEVLALARNEVLTATGSWTDADSDMLKSPIDPMNSGMSDSMAMTKVLWIRQKFANGVLKSEQSLHGAFFELSALLPQLSLNESIVEHSLVSADIVRELGWQDLEQSLVASAVHAAFELKCETLLTKCQLRLDHVWKDLRMNREPAQVQKGLLNVVDQVNDRDLLRDIVRSFGKSHQPDSAALATSCIQRITALNALIATTADSFRAKQSSQLEQLVEKQAGDLAHQAASAERASIRSLFLARAGFVVLCGLAIILLRERWNLRKINVRLKAEIEQNERQRIERERIELRLAQTERLESLGAIAGGIAHDFNNLLVGVIGNADLLKRESSLTPTASIYVDCIIRSAETAAELSHKMLAYAGRQVSTKKVVELNSLIQRLLPLFRAGLGPRHTIQFSADSGQLHTEADVAQVEQIAMNLMTNAFQAMGDRQGTIQLKTGSCTLEEIPVNVMTIGNRKEGGRFIWFEVTDSGPGIPSSVQARIFEPFYSTKRQTTGHGFGLSVVYGHVNRHNGFIQLSSIEGHGTTFRVLLPWCQNAGPEARDEQTVVRTRSTQKCGDVLIVDDRRDVLDVLEHTLTNAGLKTHAFTSSTEALEFLLDDPNVGCLLLDIMMPEVDGITILQELVQRDLKVPVIVMSGFSPASPETFGEFPSVKAVVQKPFRAENILHIVLQTIEDHGSTAPATIPADSTPTT